MHFNDKCTVFVHISVILRGFSKGPGLYYVLIVTHRHTDTHTDTETKYPRPIYDKFSFFSKLKKCRTLACWIKSVRNMYWFWC
jgi:hypothetical protein